MSQENSMKGVEQLDPNMRLAGPDGKEWQWVEPLNSLARVAGFPWLNHDRIYRRLPQHPKWSLRPAVDSLANCTAGGQLHFATNSPRLAVRVKLAAPASMYHMPSTGQCGFDCYLGEPGKQRYLATTRYDHKLTEYESTLFDSEDASNKVVTLNFPLYQGVKEVLIGLEPGASLSEPPAYENQGKVIFYGTSITQGGCAARPGMAFTNILSRRINREFINLGFSGNGKGEPELAHLITEITDPACYILDYDANVASVQDMQETLPQFISILRESFPETPILVISRVPTAREYYDTAAREKRLGKLQVQRNTVQQLQSAGDANISFLSGEELMGDSYLESTVDGSHPTDLGFWLFANALEPEIKKLLG